MLAAADVEQRALEMPGEQTAADVDRDRRVLRKVLAAQDVDGILAQPLGIGLVDLCCRRASTQARCLPSFCPPQIDLSLQGGDLGIEFRQRLGLQLIGLAVRVRARRQGLPAGSARRRWEI